jgi:hypothetical protein
MKAIPIFQIALFSRDRYVLPFLTRIYTFCDVLVIYSIQKKRIANTEHRKPVLRMCQFDSGMLHGIIFAQTILLQTVTIKMSLINPQTLRIKFPVHFFHCCIGEGGGECLLCFFFVQLPLADKG